MWLQSLFTSATAYFSLFCIPLTTKFGWSDSDFALAYTIYMFTYCAVGFIGGSLAEKFSPRMTIYMGLCLFAGGWFLTGFAGSIPQLYIFYGLMAGAGGGMIYPASRLDRLHTPLNRANRAFNTRDTPPKAAKPSAFFLKFIIAGARPHINTKFENKLDTAIPFSHGIISLFHSERGC